MLKSSSKVSFCLMDVFEERRRAAEPRYLLCDRDVPQGISVGWADEYAEYLPGQHVDVTGLARGLYCLRSVADPAGTIRERDETNNAAVIPVVLSRGRARVARTAACGAPPPA